MASMFELVRNVYYFIMGLLVMYVSFLSDQYLWSKGTTPAAFQYIEEICIQPNFRNYTFDCTELLKPDPEDVKAVTSKEDLLMVALTKTSTLAQSLLDDLNELNRSSLGWGWVDNKSEVLDCIEEFDIIVKLFDEAVSSLRGGDPATLHSVFRHIEIYQTACMNRLREVQTSFTKKDSKMSTKQRSLFVALFITSSLLKKSIELGESTWAWLTHFHSKEFKRRDDVKPDIIVAQDGSGHVKTIFEAVELAPKFGTRPFVIKIMAGVYREYVVIPKDKTNLRFVGESSKTTIITDNRYHCGVSIIESATMHV